MPVPTWRTEFAKHKKEMSEAFAAFVAKVTETQDKHHTENKETLQTLTQQSIENGVKLDRLYGTEGQPGAVDRLTDKVNVLGNKIVYASGFIAAVVILVGWWIASSSHK